MQNNGFAGKYLFTNLHVILTGIFSPKLFSDKRTAKAERR